MKSINPQETIHSIERHLGRFQPTSLSIASAHSWRSPAGATAPSDINEGRADAYDPSDAAHLTEGLWELLGRYVALLDSSEQGGWSRDDDEVILRIVSLLGLTHAKAPKPTKRAMPILLTLFVLLGLFAGHGPAYAVAQWSRLYSMPCQGCHTTYPRLNLTGLQFRRNGYRFSFNEKAVINSRDALNYIGPTWTPSETMIGTSATAKTDGYKIHIGGPVGRSAGFLIQPTPGSRADFNLVQGIVAFGSEKQSYRLVGGRLLSWLNGGSTGAGDRTIGATVPRMFSELHGVSPGGIGNGARFEVNWASGMTLALYTSDMEATETHAQTNGISLIIPLDTRSVSALEFFAAHASVPISGQADAQASRYGLLVNHWIGTAKQPERLNVLAGMLYGSENRAVKTGLPTNWWTGFFELDWQARPGLTFFTRHDWEHNALAGGSATTFTLGAAVPITRNLRLDLDVVPHRPNASNVQTVMRLRLVY